MLADDSEKRKVSYKLYPSKQQEALLFELLRSHQQLYNAALQERSEAWQKCGKTITYADQCKSLTVIRQSMPEWTFPNCSSQQMTLRKLDKAFKAFSGGSKPAMHPDIPDSNPFNVTPASASRAMVMAGGLLRVPTGNTGSYASAAWVTFDAVDVPGKVAVSALQISCSATVRGGCR